ncbi:hypothetical protein BCV69DRAFT_298580 [Microstroma glucosiphilum]|uniref:Uncharacterized protein n=1 Tax=Pseudomicrostroma glucosiphilum TaxID=1684307 RepID=A0A316UB09_9BASI|nr:hypothetical protein BCV69DRAFT_298580 [Pseudomicrostroma glucosiphilum]PWN21573.1 hypothetical protein BCV69DRAFT_298580 [Pseudomicrostroma glucosiphilum]
MPASTPSSYGNGPSSTSSAPHMNHSFSPLLVAPAPRRPIPLVSRNRREREREHYGQLHLASSSSTTSSSRPAPYRFPAPAGTEGRRASLTSSVGSGNGIAMQASRSGSRMSGSALNASSELARVATLSDEFEDRTTQEDGEAAAELLHQGVSRLALEHRRPPSLHLYTFDVSSKQTVPFDAQDEGQMALPRTPTDLRSALNPTPDVLGASLFDPDLTPTKARLKELKKVLASPSVDPAMRRLSASLLAQEFAAGRQSPTPSVSSSGSRRTSLVDSLASPASSALSRSTSALSRSEAHVLGGSPSALHPYTHYRMGSGGPQTPHDLSTIPSSPIPRNHTKNPFGKSFSRAMRELEDLQLPGGEDALGFLPMGAMYERGQGQSPQPPHGMEWENDTRRATPPEH